jgi:hypothetical protein
VSVAVFTHAPLHSESPLAQVTTQLLLAQLAVEFAGCGQTLPQRPQLFRSARESMQPMPQRTRVPRHSKSHAPLQTGRAFAGASHTSPQVPQFEVSERTSTQEPPQFMRPPLHESSQLPDAHTCPVVHSFPQPPQFWTSVFVLTQAPSSQSVCPEMHSTWQAGVHSS